MRRGEEHALLRVDHAGRELLEPVARLTVLASGADVAYVTEPGVDTGIATQLARVAQRQAPQAEVTVVEGRHEHVNFIARPRPVRIRVLEAVPPWPPKLLDMAEQAIDNDEELPPIELRLEAIDLTALAGVHPEGAVLFPCRSGGLELDRPVHFLDAGPDRPADWTLVGCDRSAQIHAALYGAEPPRFVNMCPRKHVGTAPDLTLLKCCLLERGLEAERAVRVVPWGANHREVERAIRELAGVRPE